MVSELRANSPCGEKKVEIRDWIFVGEGGIVSESRVEVAYLYLSIFSGEVRK